MPIVAVRIPQIGEGLQEARLVAVLKQPGDKIRRDEPIYQMETDKAVMDVESPYEGVLTEWLAPVDTILPIGGAVANMDVAEGTKEQAAGHGPPAAAEVAAPVAAATAASAGGSRNANVPPRTRAYAKEKGIDDDQLALIASAGSKLMPSDIDAFLNGGTAASAPAAPALSSTDAYAEQPVGQAQRLLSSRLVRGNQLVVPGTITVVVNWEPILKLREKVKASSDAFKPSAFTMFAFAVAQTLKDYPAFRTTLIGDSVFRVYKHAHLGIAVSLPGDDLVLAVVEDSDALDWRAFAERSKDRIDAARGGKDQANEAVTISLTNMQNFGLRDAVPVVVPPSVATLFLGEIYNGLDPEADTVKIRKTVNLALTFDHRILNGVGAANFINAIKKACENIETLIG